MKQSTMTPMEMHAKNPKFVFSRSFSLAERLSADRTVLRGLLAGMVRAVVMMQIEARARERLRLIE